MRVLLVSDMHYTTEETHDELKRLHPEANASLAAGSAFGYTQHEKVQKVLQAILWEHERSPLDLVLVLGDLSLDDFGFRNLPDNYCRRFLEECMRKCPCPVYALPGNHDSYPERQWREVFGYGRQYAVERGGALFVMLDHFRTCPAAGASGSPYTPADTAFLSEVLAAHPGRPGFLCAHHVQGARRREEYRRGGWPIRFLLSRAEDRENGTLRQALAALPAGACFLCWEADRYAAQCAMGLGDSRLPLAVALGRDGRGLYATANYQIRLGERLLNVLRLADGIGKPSAVPQATPTP